jgi:predicted nucleic acid-binding protein
VILVDSSVWIDYLNGDNTRQTDWLDRYFGVGMVAIGDLVAAEVLQGIQWDSEYAEVRFFFDRFQVFELAGMVRSVRAADRYRLLRKKGITVRSTIDSLIAGFCIDEGIPLLYSDRDFDPFVEHFNMPVPRGL